MTLGIYTPKYYNSNSEFVLGFVSFYLALVKSHKIKKNIIYFTFYFLFNIFTHLLKRTLSASLALIKSLAKGLGNFPLLIHHILNFVEAVNKLGNCCNKALKNEDAYQVQDI